jgi:hypothetical protein
MLLTSNDPWRFTNACSDSASSKWKTTWMVGNDSMRIGLFWRPQAAKIANLDNKTVIEHVAFLTDERHFNVCLSRLEQLGIALIWKGYRPGSELFYLAFPEAKHDENAWAARSAIPFQFLFGKLPTFRRESVSRTDRR